MISRVLFYLWLAWFLLLTDVQSQPVFPGAEGFGSQTPAGRGGEVCRVTNLNDSGEGSLRYCVEKSGPRTVVFTTGGTIRLKSNLTINHPYVSIYGQTAPGDGIMITGDSTIQREPFTVATHDVLIQHLRFRAGAADAANCCRDAFSILGKEGSTTGKQTYNIVLDHCSFSWGTDEILSSWYDVNHLTISNSIIGPSLYNGSNDEGPGSRGALFGSAGSHSISFHHNLIIHSQERNPGVFTDSGVVDIVNNLVYNWGHSGAEFISSYGDLQANFINNLYVSGNDSNLFKPELSTNSEQDGHLKLFARGNIALRNTASVAKRISYPGQFLSPAIKAPNRFPAPVITMDKTLKLMDSLPIGVGATLPRRDKIDRQLITDLKNSGGRIPQCIAAGDKGWGHGCRQHVGGWPSYARGEAYKDSDKDGVPDDWEKNNALDPLQPDSVAGTNKDGYTAIEAWAFSFNP